MCSTTCGGADGSDDPWARHNGAQPLQSFPSSWPHPKHAGGLEIREDAVDSLIEKLSRDLGAAEARGIPTPAASTWETRLTLAQAYDTQHRTAQRRLERDRLAGYKVGLTNEPAQKAFGAATPVYGRLFAQRVYPSGSDLPIGQLISPRIEPEVAFRMGRRLAGRVSRADAEEAIEGVAAAFEIVDSRIDGWAQTVPELVADNAAGCGAVIGDWRPYPLSGELSQLQCEFVDAEGGKSKGTAAAVFGDPVLAVVWLAGALADHGLALNAGDIVLSGSWCTPSPLVKQGAVSASFGVLGSVTAEVTGHR